MYKYKLWELISHHHLDWIIFSLENFKFPSWWTKLEHDEFWCLDCIFLSWSFLIGKCIDGWIYSLTCKYNFDAIFFYFVTYIDKGIFSILGIIFACIYCFIVELCFYIAYLYVWAMFTERFYLEIEVILISHLDLQTKYKRFKVTLFFSLMLNEVVVKASLS